MGVVAAAVDVVVVIVVRVAAVVVFAAVVTLNWNSCGSDAGSGSSSNSIPL